MAAIPNTQNVDAGAEFEIDLCGTSKLTAQLYIAHPRDFMMNTIVNSSAESFSFPTFTDPMPVPPPGFADGPKREFVPVEPQSLEETGLSRSLLPQSDVARLIVA